MMSKTFVGKSLIFLLIIGSCIADPEKVYGKHGSSIIFKCPYRKTSTHNVVWRIVNNDGTLIQISDGLFIAESSIRTRVSIVGDYPAGEYNLELRKLQESDEVVYRCNAVQEKDFKLELFAAPSSLALQNLTTTNTIPGIEGQSLTLRCTAEGGKPPPLVTISVDNVSRSNEQSVETTISTLHRQHDKQMVQCNATSSDLTAPLTATGALYLNLKPLPPVISPDQVSVDEPNQLVAFCTSTGSRPAAIFLWTIGQTDISSDSTTQSTKNTADDTYTVTSVLKYNVNRTHDGQTIACSAMNIVDTSRTSSTLYVRGPPQAPRNFTVLIYTESSIVVQWEAGYNGGHEQTFYVEYRGFGSNIWIVVKIQNSEQTGRQTYTLTGLKDDSLYEFRMYAENKLIKSLPTQTEIIRTLRDCKCPLAEALIGGVAGVLIAVIVIMLIIIIVLMRRKQKIVINTPIPHTSRWKDDTSYRNPMDRKGDDELSGINKHSAGLTQEYETLGMKDNPNTYSELLTQKDKHSAGLTQEYETLGMKDNPNTYSELLTQKDKHSAGLTQEYETLGIKDNPNTYSELLTQKDKHCAGLTQEYETLGIKDNPNTYSELLTQKDKQISTSAQVYETLGMADNRNTYSELQGKKDQKHHKTTADHYQPVDDHDKVTMYENTKV